MSAIAARGLSFSYRKEMNLTAVDLTAEYSQVTAIVGPNGAGKTTLLRLLAGLLQPDAGSVLLDGGDLSDRTRREVARLVAMAPQAEQPQWPMTVYQMVELGRAPLAGWWLPYSHKDREAIQRVLQQTGLTDLSHRLVTELSGGEYSRTVFARTLAQEARIVLLDEPTAHLDLKHQTEILQRIRWLAHDRGLAVIVTLHDLNQAAAYADRVVLLRSTRVEAWGSPEEVLTPENLERTYGIAVSVVRHPLTDQLWISPRGGT